jgi:benzoate-CoA ligase family protein
MHETFNVCEWLVDRHVREGRGDRVALKVRGRSVTYEELLTDIERAAAGLRSLGVRPEERVAMVQLDSVEFAVTLLAALRIGAVPAPANPLLPGRDLGVIVEDSRARVAVVSDDRAQSVADMMAGAPELESVVVTGDGHVDATMTWGDLLRAGEGGGDGSVYATWVDSPGPWLCTSGTTGHPKLAMHTHGHMQVTHETYARQVLGITEDDRCYSVGPMFHAYGLGNSITFPLGVGATAIVDPTRPPTPQLVAEIVTRERPTLFFCIPTFYAALNGSDIADDTFSSVRLAVSAAESLPAETFRRFRDRFGVTILDGIGSTELLHIFLSNTTDQLEPGTSGVPVPGYDVRIVDEHGADQPSGEPGELLVRGGSAASGYWCRDATNRQTFIGEWTRTGDLYVRSEEGFHTYLGRVDDMLRVGGEWVSPAEVEAALIEHEDVLEAAVVGERDDAGILRPIAFVIAAVGSSPTTEALLDFCRERLAGYKRPRRIELVDDLPKTATGKIQRYKLRGDA